MHQTLVNPRGQKLSNLKPDIQYIGPDGKIYIEEVIDTHRQKGRRRMFEDLLGSDLGNYIETDVR